MASGYRARAASPECISLLISETASGEVAIYEKRSTFKPSGSRVDGIHFLIKNQQLTLLSPLILVINHIISKFIHVYLFRQD